MRVQTPKDWPKEIHPNYPRQPYSQNLFFLAVWGSFHPGCAPTGASPSNYHWLPLSLSIVSVLQSNRIRRLFFIRHCAPKLVIGIANKSPVLRGVIGCCVAYTWISVFVIAPRNDEIREHRSMSWDHPTTSKTCLRGANFFSPTLDPLGCIKVQCSCGNACMRNSSDSLAPLLHTSTSREQIETP